MKRSEDRSWRSIAGELSSIVIIVGVMNAILVTRCASISWNMCSGSKLALVAMRCGAAAAVLVAFFGEKTHFTVDNDLLIGVTRSYHSFTQALNEKAGAKPEGIPGS